jgi:hypothetical protein
MKAQRTVKKCRNSLSFSKRKVWYSMLNSSRSHPKTQTPLLIPRLMIPFSTHVRALSADSRHITLLMAA